MLRTMSVLLAVMLLGGACASTEAVPLESTTAPATPVTSSTTLAAAGRLVHLASTGAMDAWAIDSAGRALRSVDGGRTWVPSGPPELRTPVAAAAFLEDAAWIAYADGTVVSTFDGGATWRSAAVPHTNPDFEAVAMVFPDTGHGWLLAEGDGAAGTVFVELYATDDGGRTWTAMASPPPTEAVVALESGHWSGLAATPEGRVWVTKDHGARLEPWLAVSTDGGATWEERLVPIPAEGSCATLAPHVDGVLFGAVLVECDGVTWFAMSGDDGVTWDIAELPAPAVGLTLYEDGALAWGREVMVTTEPPGGWEAVAAFPATPDVVSMPDAVNGLALVGGELWRTATAGEQWERITPSLGD